MVGSLTLQISSANQWTGFYMIPASVLKGLNENDQFLYISYSIEVTCNLYENTILLKYFLDENEALEGRFPT